MAAEKVPDHPFERIALGLSGGGYRAAAFHLGSMSYLNRVSFEGKTLLQHVEVISTVSGGTIPGIMYSLFERQGKDFGWIYKRQYEAMRNTDLIDASLGLLESKEGWNPKKRHNLINAFAQVYDQKFFDGGTFDIYYEKESHLKEVIFNATEFNNGLPFRFQNQGLFGNYYLKLNPSRQEVKDRAERKAITQRISGEVKLGDIMAASSCFPGGFEPLDFPEDFCYPGSVELDKVADFDDFTSGLGLMDAGIIDNQGLQGILYAEQRMARKEEREEERNRLEELEEGGSDNKDLTTNEEKEPYTKQKERALDLVIVSDVSSPYLTDFQFSKIQGKAGWRNKTINSIKKQVKSYKNIGLIAFLLFTLIAVASVIWLQTDETGTLFPALALAGSAALAFTTGILLLLAKYIQNKLPNLANSVPADFRKYLPYFDQIKLGTYENMLLERANSLSLMIQEVFMKQIRRLLYNKLYDNPHFNYRRISNSIYELRKEGIEGRNYRLSRNKKKLEELLHPALLEPSKKIMANAQDAFEMGTTLWFTSEDNDDNKLQKLISNGQVTMCYNLLVYISEIKLDKHSGFDKLPLETQNAVHELEGVLLKDWGAFNESPGFMLREMHDGLGIKAKNKA